MKTKIILEFTEEAQDKVVAERTLKAEEAFQAISDIRDQVFRPARKHGYNDQRIQGLISKLNDLCEKDAGAREEPDDASTLIGLLEDKVYEILSERGLTHLL